MIPKPNSTEPVRLPVVSGGVTLVDADIAQRLAGRRLYDNGAGYVMTSIDGRHRYLHQFVTPAPPGKELDHINHNRRDNRRANLRHLTHRENIWRRRTRVGRSGYRGVVYHVPTRRYLPCVRWQGKSHWRRTYASALIAAFVRDDAARRITGMDEGLNFPLSIRPGQVRGLLEALGTCLFGVLFVRRADGAVRRMVCRKATRNAQAGRGLAFEPAQRNLYSVYDVRKRAYRFIPLENVLCLTCNGTRYRVTA